MGSSIVDTISSMIKHASVNKRESHKLINDAEKLSRKYKMPERRLWYLKVKAFSDSGQWPQLRSLADSRAKPPIGYKPFALVAIQHDQSAAEITRYIEKVPGPEERYNLFCQGKIWKRAVDEAVKLKDIHRVANVRSICNDADVQRTCEQMMARLSS